MKKEFSQKWKSSVKPRKQRKWRANAPLHSKHSLLSAHLSKELRKKYGRRNFPLRKGDEVKIMVGSFKGKSGKVTEVSMVKSKVYIENIQRSKKDGSKMSIPLDPSNLIVLDLNLGDKRRMEALTKARK